MQYFLCVYRVRLPVPGSHDVVCALAIRITVLDVILLYSCLSALLWRQIDLSALYIAYITKLHIYLNYRTLKISDHDGFLSMREPHTQPQAHASGVEFSEYVSFHYLI